MEVHTSKLDQGLTLTIPEAFAAELGLEEDSLVDISLQGSSIIICRAKQRRVQLEDLLAKVTEANRHSEIETGGAVGIEGW
jgi:antitoxin component of MazEF toxin-antitoxin module